MSYDGASLAPDCVSTYEQLKSGKSHRYILFGLSSDNATIFVEKTSTDGSYDDFTEDLPETECRWAVYDLRDDSKVNRIILFFWAPDNAKMKEKMLFASSRDTLKRALAGVHSEIQATEPSEVSYDTVTAKLAK